MPKMGPCYVKSIWHMREIIYRPITKSINGMEANLQNTILMETKSLMPNIVFKKI